MGVITGRIVGSTGPTALPVPTVGQVVENVTALRALAGSVDLPAVTLMQHTGNTLRGGGTFEWRTVAGVDDGGTRFNAGGVGSSGEGWQRVDVGLASDALWYGALGDGVADDAPSIQLAIDAAAAGTTVMLPPGTYLCLSPITVKNNLTLVGAGQSHVSALAGDGGFNAPATMIRDGRTNPSTPLITLGPDSGGQPTSRGCSFRDICFDFPSTGKTDYSISTNGSTAITFTNCRFTGALSSGGVPQPGGSDPGIIYLGSFEAITFEHCTFHGGSRQVYCLGSGAGGPLTFRNCWFYDCNWEHIYVASNGDHDYVIDGCAFDPLYRTTLPAYGVVLKANGYRVSNTSFYGELAKGPTGTYLYVLGTGKVESCAIHTKSTAITSGGGQCAVEGCAIWAYCGINHTAGILTTKGNLFTAAQVADNSPGGTNPFDEKRGIVISDPYAGASCVSVGPDTFADDGAYTFANSYWCGTDAGAVGYLRYMNGIIRYDDAQDASTNRVALGGMVTLEQLRPQVLNLGSGTTLAHYQSGCIITNENYNGNVTYTLPPIQPGLVYTFEKRENNASPTVTPTMTITADGADMIYDPRGAVGGSASISNSLPYDYGASVTVVGSYWYDASAAADVLVWRVTNATGGWAADKPGRLAPGSQSFGDGEWHIQYQRLQLTSAQRLTLAGTARYILTDL